MKFINKTILLPGLLVFLLTIFVSCTKTPPTSRVESTDTTSLNKGDNTLSDSERSDGWKLLFNGTDLTGWKRYNQETIGPLWQVEDGMIVYKGKANMPDENAKGSLVTIDRFDNFELSFEWKISSGGNSGVLYHVVEDEKFENDYETGPEYQVLDDLGWKGEALKAEQFCASNYDMYAASTDKKLLPASEWNKGVIIYDNGHVEHWLNGEKVVEFSESSNDFQHRLEKSKWKDYPEWNKAKSGSISLQDHGDPVYFRNIKIKSL